jgi:hypothetical protein
MRSQIARCQDRGGERDDRGDLEVGSAAADVKTTGLGSVDERCRVPRSKSET